jgi:hypothetical protein
VVRYTITRDGRDAAKPWSLSVTAVPKVEGAEVYAHTGALSVADDPEQAIRQFWRHRKVRAEKALTEGRDASAEEVAVSIEPEPRGQLAPYLVTPGKLWDPALKKHVHPLAWWVLAHDRRHAVDLVFAEIANAAKIPTTRSYRDGWVGSGDRSWTVATRPAPEDYASRPNRV